MSAGAVHVTHGDGAMYRYDVKVTWREGKQGVIHAAGKPAVNIATPPEFGGPDGVLSPEELLVASVESCLMTTFLYFVELLRIGLLSYESNATGVMEKTPNGFRFTKMDVAIIANVGSESDRQKALDLKKKLEKYCPVSAALNFQVGLALEVNIEV